MIATLILINVLVSVYSLSVAHKKIKYKRNAMARHQRCEVTFFQQQNQLIMS